MPAQTTRQEARARLRKLYESCLDRFIPPDENIPLKGRTFIEFEEQTYRHGNEVLAAMLEERAKLDAEALVTTAGRCPYCEADRTYLDKKMEQKEVRAPCGTVVLALQAVRCRKCGGAFSPSAALLEPAGGSAPHAFRGAAGRARGRRALL